MLIRSHSDTRRVARRQQLLAAALAFAVSPVANGQELAVRIATRNGAAFHAGEAINLEVRYENAGDDAFFLYRAPRFGPDALDIVARQGAIETHCGRSAFSCARARERLYNVPLLQGRALVERVVLNDLERVGEPNLPLDPGKYALSAILVDSASHGTQGAPQWQGRAVSNELTIEILSPEAAVLAEWRDKLKMCVDSVTPGAVRLPPDYIKIVEYYSLVRDPKAADLLWALQSKVEWDWAPMGAIALQGRCQDLARIEALRESPSYDTEDGRAFVRSLLDQVRRGGQCDDPTMRR